MLDTIVKEGVILIFIVQLIRILADIFTFLVVIKIVLSYFLSPYHPVREALDRIVEPVLSPIRSRIPPVGMFDFSPLVLIILIQIAVSFITYFLLQF